MANSDLQPATVSTPIRSGTILSQNFRSSVLGGEVSNSPIARDNLSLVQNRQRQLDLESSAAIVDQQQSFTLFNTGIQNLRTDIGKLSSGLNSIALLLQQDAATEQNRILTEQEQERRLTEQEIRIGKENEIEQKIQNAVTEPAQRMVPEVQNLFGGVQTALAYLFGGWLTAETAKSITTAGQESTNLFTDLKFDILKKIGIVAGGLLAIGAGFNMVKRTMGSIIDNLWKLFIPKPKLGSGSGLGGALPGLGKFVGFLSGYLNLKNKEYTDSILLAMSAASMAPGPIGAIGKIAGLAFTADEIAEAFGKNIFGDERDKIVDQIAQRFMGKTEAPPAQAAPPTSTPPSGATATPTTPAVPPAPSSGTQAPTGAPQVAPQQTMTGQDMTPATQTAAPASPLSPERISQFEQAWSYRNNPMARGRIEDAWGKLSDQEKLQAKEWAASKGYNWSEMRLPDPVTTTQAIPETRITPMPAVASAAGVTTTTAQTSSFTQTTAAEITPQPQISNIPREPQQVGQLPEPNPRITMMGPFSGTAKPQPPPITNGALTDVPLINSSNPDNFYVLYSQLCYNVVT